MSSALSAAGLLSEIQMAEKDLAMYAAIIGHRPKVDPVEATQDKAIVEVAVNSEPQYEIPELHEPRRLTIWMRHVSHEARKRFDEAKMRLAS